MDKETTVETAFSVWGSDEESVLDKGVGGLDPAHSDDRQVNGQEKTRERPALIRIAKNGYDLAGTKCVLNERSCSDYAGSRSSRIDAAQSAYHQLHGHKYDWNSHPMAPPGLRAVIYLDPDNRTSWGARGLDAWYCGPDFDHYRCCSFYVCETRAYRTTATFNLFPQHCSLPEFLPVQHATEVFEGLK